MHTETRPLYMPSIRNPLQTQGHTEIERMELNLKNIFHASENQKEVRSSTTIPDKIDFKIKTITEDKEGHYIKIKGLIREEDITIKNIYAPNTGEPQHIRKC